MNNRPLQPGDLCVIVGCGISDIDLGRSVTLVSFHNAYTQIPLPDGTVGRCATPVWVVTAPGLHHAEVDKIEKRGYAYYRPYWLRRISGDPDAETETVGQEEEIYAG